MKRILTLFTALGLVSSAAWADEGEAEATGYNDVVLTDGGPTEMEDKRDYENLVTLGMGFIPATLKFSFRRALNDNVSVMMGSGYGSATWTLGESETRLQRVLGTAGVDFHPIGNGLHGFYVGPRATYTNWSAGSGNNEISSARLSVRGIIGWRWIFDPGIGVGLGLGGKYTNSVRELGDTTDLPAIKEGIGPALELQLGWAF